MRLAIARANAKLYVAQQNVSLYVRPVELNKEAYCPRARSCDRCTYAPYCPKNRK